MIFGLAMGFVVVAMVRAERAGHIRVPAALTFLGAASYSIYLLHNPVAALSARLFDDWRATFAVRRRSPGSPPGSSIISRSKRPLLRLLSPKRTSRSDAAAAADGAPATNRRAGLTGL